MKNVVTGNKLRVGDKIRIINATVGAYGSNDCVGVVVDRVPFGVRVSGLGCGEDTILVKLDKETGFKNSVYWGVGVNGLYEILHRQPKKKHIEIDVIIKDKMTKVVIDNKVGVAKCKEEDSFNEAYGLILAIAGAYGLSREKREALVDALYDDIKTLEEYDSLEILEELKNRIEY